LRGPVGRKAHADGNDQLRFLCRTLRTGHCGLFE
jgi:hypothetical protein